MAMFMAMGLVCASAWAATPVPIGQVHITDEFWTPKQDVWRNTTLPDCLSKFEKTGAFANFDRVRDGQTGEHGGPPWYDGLIYEMIRAAADYLAAQPDPALEARLDGYIERIAAAAAKDPEGYIETYTQLMEPDHRWGLNGGYERISHDLYNAGALMEAGVHYCEATGKTRLLNAAVRMANLMFMTMGPPPKRNIVPSHPLAEEAAVHLYCLFRDHPELKAKMDAPVSEQDFLKLAEFWLEARGHNCGSPDWNRLNEADCQKFIRDKQYGDDRPSWGAYAQDHKPLLEQETIEGHAVRATLLCAGLAAAAAADSRGDYAREAQRLWTNMVSRKMHLTGGVGAFAGDEKFGPDYVLPNDAYLETCAAVGAGFFHENMFLLFKEGKYADELERVLYNGVLGGVSLQGNSYFYENPLEASNRQRWDWHGCPCCPPMFLKIMAAMPGYIYATDSDTLYVNLFVGSRMTTTVHGKKLVLAQKTRYPWDGKVDIAIETDGPLEFDLRVRIPEWSEPFPFNVNNAAPERVSTVQGYAALRRTWNTGDHVSFEIPLPIRLVRANPNVKADTGRAALMRGPIVYCVESAGNTTPVKALFLQPGAELRADYHADLLGGVSVITGKGLVLEEWPDGVLYRNRPVNAAPVDFTAIPFYTNSNRDPGDMAVWLPVEGR